MLDVRLAKATWQAYRDPTQPPWGSGLMQTKVAYRANGAAAGCNDRGEGGTVIVMTNNYRNCQTCRRPASIVGRISNKGMCGQCSVKAMLDNNSAIHHKRGPLYTKQIRRQFIALAELVLADGLAGEDPGHPLVSLASQVTLTDP